MWQEPDTAPAWYRVTGKCFAFRTVSSGFLEIQKFFFIKSTENNPESPIVDFINHSENPNGVIKITSEKIYFQATETIQAKDSNSEKSKGFFFRKK